ncbi:MAG: metallophosphoesterase [Candidatus Woesearchaeota archaeon]
MKILALSDVHGDKHLIKEMAEKAALNKVDLVLLAGDFVGDDGSVEGLVGPFRAKGIEVGILPGNHEGMAEVSFLVEKYGAKNMHGYALKRGDVGIFGCGYSNIGFHQMDEKSVFETLKRSHDSLKDVKKMIMVTHTHPEESILGLGMFPGSEGIKRALEEFNPEFHLCGHVHETEGIEEVIGKTRVINVGRKGKIIEI